MNPKTVKNLLLKHGHYELGLKYDVMMGDWVSAIHQLLEKKNYLTIIEYLSNPKMTVDIEVFYQLSVILITNLPKATGNFFYLF